MTKLYSWVKIYGFLACISGLAACGLGSLMSVDNITNATRNEVVNLGDSIFALSGEESDYLHSLSGETFRRYAVSGAYMSGDLLGMAPDILTQFDMALDDDPEIDTVIMDGGGNDILIPATALDPYNCKKNWYERQLSDSCQDLIDDIYVEAVDTINEIGRNGVDNIVFQGYYNLKFGLIGSTTLNDAVAYGNLKLSQAVENATATDNNRIFIDPTPAMTTDDITFDGVHPDESGSEKLAILVWEELEPLL